MNQYIELTFAPSAFKHGFREEDIEECLFNEDTAPTILGSTEDKTVKVAYGMTYSGQYLEIAFRKETKTHWHVFHAMTMRDSDKKRFCKRRN